MTARRRLQGHRIDVVIEPRAMALWRRTDANVVLRVRRAASAALAAATKKRRVELAICLANDAFVRRLNRDFRGKDKPTNVLSFPAAPVPSPKGRLLSLGDVVLAYETVTREAAQQGKTLMDHLLHLVVHGVLHLVGFVHEKPKEAARMEALETKVLASFGIADPYAAAERRA